MVIARQMVMFCACAELVDRGRHTLSDIGKYFTGNYTHASVIYARNNITNLYITDAEIRRRMDFVSTSLANQGLINTRQNIYDINK
jgi:chromosomal replication initiation ATPase DnaA